MNKGLRRATGGYVWFLNADDTLYTAGTVQRTVASLKEKVSLPDVIYGETRIVDAAGKPLRVRRLKTPERLSWRDFRVGILVCHQSFISEREIAPLYNTDYRLTVDYNQYIQCLKRAKKVHNTHLVLSNSLEEGLSGASRKASLKGQYEIMYRYYRKILTIALHGWFAVRFCFAERFKGRV